MKEPIWTSEVDYVTQNNRSSQFSTIIINTVIYARRDLCQASTSVSLYGHWHHPTKTRLGSATSQRSHGDKTISNSEKGLKGPLLHHQRKLAPLSTFCNK